MGFLRLLAAGRTAVLDGFFSGLTYFGSELAFMAAALLMFWCIDKRQGYYVFLVGAFGTICNQFLKLAFRIPRPWVLDPEFQIVEAARADATTRSCLDGKWLYSAPAESPVAAMIRCIDAPPKPCSRKQRLAAATISRRRSSLYCWLTRGTPSV